MPGSVDAGAVSDMAAAKRASGQGAMRAFLWRKRGNGEERCEQCRNERQEEGTRGWQTTGRPKERNSDEGRRHGRPSCFERCRRRCWGTGGPQVSCTVAFLPVLEAWPMHEVGSLGRNAQRLNPKRASEPASRNLLVVGAALAARAMPSENQTVSLRTAAPVCSCSCEHARCIACRLSPVAMLAHAGLSQSAVFSGCIRPVLVLRGAHAPTVQPESVRTWKFSV